MPVARLSYRDRASLPRLVNRAPAGPVVLDTNVLINTLAGRAPPEVTALLSSLTATHVSAVTLAELNWTRGRLDAAHPQSAAAIAGLDALIERFEPARVLIPSAGQWSAAGALAGRAAKGIAGATRTLTATDRSELVGDALIAVTAREIGATIVTADADFDLFLQLDPSLSVLFYG